MVIGVSMGGVTALRLAQRHPARVAGMVACDCRWFSPATATAVWDDRIREAHDDGMTAPGRADDRAVVSPGIRRAQWAGPGRRAAHDPEHARLPASSPALAPFSRSTSAPSSRDIAAPTCFLVGDGDGVLPTVMREMHRGLPGSTFIQIAEAGHLPNIEQPATVNHAIQAFLIQIGWHTRAVTRRPRTRSPMSRIALPTPDTMTAAQRQAYDAIVAGRRGRAPAPFLAWLHSPELASRAQKLGEFVRYETTMGPRLSELAILVVARWWSSEYEWAIHKAEALKAGVSARRDRRHRPAATAGVRATPTSRRSSTSR